MCGIIGYIAPEDYTGSILDRKKFLRQGLLTDIVRGEDSTGIMFATHDKGKNQLWYHKEACDPYEFISGPIFQKVFNTDVPKSHFVVGHNRAATIGKVNQANAHPFIEDCHDEGAVLLLHNGTLDDVSALPKIGPRRIEVDSHEICYNLAQVGPEGAKEVLESLFGAFALAWADTRDETLNLVRNNDRPLHFLRGHGGVLYFSSEALHLHWLASRLKLASKIEVFSLEPGKWLKFPYGSVKPVIRDIKLNESYWANYRYSKPANAGSSNSGGTSQRWDAASKSWVPLTKGTASGGSSAGASYHSRGKERINLGGQWREFPDALVEAMDSIGLDPTDRFCVYPWSCDKGMSDSVYVAHGWCDTLNMEVRVNRVLDYMAESVQNMKTLLCRPVGVFFEKTDYPVVLAEIVHSNGQKSLESFKSPLVDPDQPEAPSSVVTEASADVPSDGVQDGVFTDEHGTTWYVGPYDHSLTDHEWLKATEEGCAVCGEMLTIEHAEGTIWDANYPICPKCVEAGHNDITSSWLAERERGAV